MSLPLTFIPLCENKQGSKSLDNKIVRIEKLKDNLGLRMEEKGRSPHLRIRLRDIKLVRVRVNTDSSGLILKYSPPIDMDKDVADKIGKHVLNLRKTHKVGSASEKRLHQRGFRKFLEYWWDRGSPQPHDGARIA